MSFIRSSLESYLLDVIGERKKRFRDRAVFLVLLCLSVVYAAVFKVWLLLYLWDVLKRHKLPVKVISVGNLTVGGTGKTPMVHLVAKTLRDAGRRVVVLSHGYRSKGRRGVVVSDGRRIVEDDPEKVGDEALLLARSLEGIPVIVGKDRVRNGLLACRMFDPDVIVIDDGFQYMKLVRDLDIVLVDATAPFSNGRLIPAGLLREPVEDLWRADVVIITKTNLVGRDEVVRIREKIKEAAPKVKVWEAAFSVDGLERVYSSSEGEQASVRGKRFFAFSGIGNPESFYRMVEGLGGVVVGKRAFPDHHSYTVEELEALLKEASECRAELITTEKDAVSLPKGVEPDGVGVWVLKVFHVVNPAAEFVRAVEDVFKDSWLFVSNGYGEDVVTRAVLKELGDSYRVFVLPIVGSGKIFEELGVYNIGPVSFLPSGGIIKYQWTALFRDIMAGLLGIVWKQILTLRAVRHRVSRVVCVGDVYIFLLTVLFVGKRPVLIGVAKSVFIRGYFWIERFLLKRWAEAVFCRDEPTKDVLQREKINAIYLGNPIMDGFDISGKDFGIDKARYRVVGILPGSRNFVYRDIGLILDAVEHIAATSPLAVKFVMALSSTVDEDTLRGAVSRRGWDFEGNLLRKGSVEVLVEREAFGDVIAVSDVIMGLAGTGNQQAAGLGKPIVSVRDKGKLVQKALLGDSEVLVEYSYVDMAEEVLAILMDEERRKSMGEEGMKRMGPRGAVNRIVDWLEGRRTNEGDWGYTGEVSLNEVSGKGAGGH